MSNIRVQTFNSFDRMGRPIRMSVPVDDTPANVAPLVSIGNVADFDAVREVLHDSDFVQVRLSTRAGELVTYARQIRQRCGVENAWGYAQLMAGQVQEVASMVSAPALVAWLLDSGFYLVK
jgi:hypothetical protein